MFLFCVVTGIQIEDLVLRMVIHTMIPCSLADRYKHFEGTFSSILQSTLKTDAAGDQTHNIHHYKNHKLEGLLVSFFKHLKFVT